MEMFRDSYRSALSFASAARFVVDLMEMESSVPQILNVCGDDGLSKYDVGLIIARKLGVPENLIVPVLMNEGKEIFKSVRAKSTLMDNNLLKSLLGIEQIKLQL